MAVIFFFYGLAFFTMGLAVWLEGGRASDERLRRALKPLALFGLIHGGHEWLEMFQLLGLLPSYLNNDATWEAIRLGIIAVSFLPLATFGGLLFASNEHLQQGMLFIPLGLTVVWALGGLGLISNHSLENQLWPALDVWTRYTLGVPSALLAAAGLVVQQRAFRRAGLSRFGRDSLWAAIAFFWYGAVGQMFVRASPLPPSTFLNQDLFLSWFGFPIQLLRALCAALVALFVIRFLRAFEVETQKQIADLHAARLEEAERREAQRSEFLRRVVAAQEAERQRIARELHDATGQSLTALGLGLRGAATALELDKAVTHQRLVALETLTNQTLDELRHLIADLRPSHLDDLGLASALRWYASELEARTPLRTLVNVSGQERELSPTVKITLFRIAQEALTNVVKHSGAAQASLYLGYGLHAVRLSVEDDGHGFETQAPTAERPTWGLLGMQERATLLGGRCEIHSRPGRGTRVEAEIPLVAQEKPL
ncbi:MAG: sensor histidine kinase [Anaerolineales bacterium]|nr:sensor histidine kinase [Anaerolineales bacterium]